MSAIIKAEPHRVSGLSHEQVELIKQTIAKGASDIELQLFIAQCNRTGLDPFNRQIYAVKRWDSQAKKEVMSFQTSIDGMRLIAERTGDYDGQDAPLWCGKDGCWTELWTESNPPFAAKVSIYRKGIPRAFVGIAKYEAYVQMKRDGGPNTFWGKMPDHMLAKVAEALAIRKAFPQETSGVYTRDEMGDAAVEETAPALPVKQPEKTISFKKSAVVEPADNGSTAGVGSDESSIVVEAQASPAVEVAMSDCIDAPMAANFHRMFKDALPAKMRKQADEIAHDWLKAEGIIDVIGKPSALAIKKECFYEVREKAVEYAKAYSV